jgi:Zn finger protein HypA/HybF involved in hydrogenase expression
MIKPTPIKVTCQDCGFQKVFAPRSDAIMPGGYNRECCSKCGSKNIKVKDQVSIIDKIFGGLFK